MQRRDEKRRRRSGAIFLIFCCGSIAIGVLLAIIAGAATRTSTPAPPPPPPPATCQCTGQLDASTLTATVSPSTQPGGCIDIAFTFTCIDRRVETCGARAVPYIVAAIDGNNAQLVDARLTDAIVDDGATFCELSPPTIDSQFCITQSQPNSSTSTGFRLTLFDATPVLNDETITFSVLKFSGATDPIEGLCEPSFFFAAPRSLDLTPYECAAPPERFGVCCIDGASQACFEHSTSEGCDRLIGTETFRNSDARFIADATCADACDTGLSPLRTCTSVVNGAAEPDSSACTSLITNANSQLIDLELGNASHRFGGATCDASIGCCVPEDESK